MERLRKSFLATLIASGILAWLLAMAVGSYAPLVAGLASGLVAPRKGAFIAAGLGTFAAWMLWFLAGAATGPLLSLSDILSAIVGIPNLGGVLLPVVPSVLGGVVAGTASVGVMHLRGIRGSV